MLRIGRRDHVLTKITVQGGAKHHSKDVGLGRSAFDADLARLKLECREDGLLSHRERPGTAPRWQTAPPPR